MHILIIPSWYPRDDDDVNGSFFRDQAIALSKRGCKVGVIALQLRLLQQLHLAILDNNDISYAVDEGVNTYRKSGVKWFPGLPGPHSGYCRKHGLELFRRYVRAHGEPDIIHVHSMQNAGFIAEVISSSYGLPYVITEHSSFFRRDLRLSQLSAAGGTASGAERRFAVSSQFADLLREKLGAASGNWEKMPNIVHESFFSYPLSENKSRRFSFVSVCLLTRNKRVDLLIQSFAKAFGGRDSFSLQIVGDGGRRRSLEVLAHKLGVVEQVVFLGMLRRDQVARQISKADALVLSSRYETFGLVAVEALALGKPVVATRCGGPEDIVREEDGILVPKDDVSALADAMLAMYENHSNYHPQSIRDGCRARFGEEAVMSRLIKVYGEVLASSASANLNIK